jgi:hypothetical protein
MVVVSHNNHLLAIGEYNLASDDINDVLNDD